MATTKFVNGMPTGNPYIDSLIWGGRIWDERVPIKPWLGDFNELNTAYSSFLRNQYGGSFAGEDGGPPSIDPNSVSDWTSDAEVNAFVYAITLYESVCGLTFGSVPNETVADADIVWWGYSNPDSGLLGRHENLASVPDGTDQVWGYFNKGAEDSWSQLQFGGDGLNTIIHEIGHGLGLAHPHDGGGQADATTFPGITRGSEGASDNTGNWDLNQGIWTVMSYVPGWNRTPHSQSFGNQGGLGAFDIAALQLMYGANTTTAAGNNTYVLPKLNAVGTGWMCIWDTGGTDAISATGATNGVTIDLRPATLIPNTPNAGGFPSWQYRIGGGFTIAKGVVIENATRGAYADDLYGNTSANQLRGGSGADRLYAYSGNDKLYGGAGNDTLSGSTGNDIFVFDKTPSSKSNKDKITDWNKTYDTIQLENAVFAKLTKTGVLNKAYFVIAAAAKDANDYVGYNKTTGDLWYDKNGNGAGGQVAFANIGANKAIYYNDFVVI